MNKLMLLSALLTISPAGSLIAYKLIAKDTDHSLSKGDDPIADIDLEEDDGTLEDHMLD